LVSICNYPPEEIITPVFGKPNYEFIILWILNNNDVCTWGNLKEKITHSTLSNYLNKLKDRGYIKKSTFNQYKITSTGKDRYYELSEAKQKKRKLSYPPDAILRRRNYDHWILWMVSNNNYCKWSDFSIMTTGFYGWCLTIIIANGRIFLSLLFRSINLLFEFIIR